VSKAISITVTDEEAETIRVDWLRRIHESEALASQKRIAQVQASDQATICKRDAKKLEDDAADLRARYAATFGPVPDGIK
jgi:hypothetical protein